MNPPTTTERATALLDEERANGYRAAFRSAVERLTMFAALVAGDRGLTRDHEVALRTAMVGLVADMQHAALPFAVQEELTAHAKTATEEAIARLGRRAAGACCYADVMTGAAHDADCDGVQKPVTDAPGGETP